MISISAHWYFTGTHLRGTGADLPASSKRVETKMLSHIFSSRLKPEELGDFYLWYCRGGRSAFYFFCHRFCSNIATFLVQRPNKTFVVVNIVRLQQSLHLKGYTFVFEIVLALHLFMLTGWRRDLGSARNERLWISNGTSGTQIHYIGDSLEFWNIFVGELRTENRHIEDLISNCSAEN